MDGGKTDFFSKKISNSRSFKKRNQGSSIGIWIVLLLLIGAVWGANKLFYADPDLSETPKTQENEFSLGNVVQLSGELKSDGDIVTHTHTLTTEQYGILPIKSKTINLGDYQGRVTLTGNVEKFYQGKPIIEVSQLSGTLLEKGEEPDIVLDKNPGSYYPEAGIHFLPSFFDEYVLLNNGENGEFLIQNLTTDQKISLNYFRCNDSDPNRNCKGMVDFFSQGSRSFVTSNGDVYYKQSEINSRFISNGNRWGVFINDVPEEEVMQLKDYIVFANEKIMKNWIDYAATRICQNEEETLQKITDSYFILKQAGLVAIISGEGNSHMLTCEIQVDFSLPKKGLLLSLTQEGEKKATQEVVIIKDEDNTSKNQPKEEDKQEKKEEKSDSKQEQIPPQEGNSTNEQPSWDPNIAQFPLNPEKGLKYTRKGNYTVNFPSSNISYAASSVRENFGNKAINCTYVINVIKYADRDNLETDPAIRIYECNVSEPILAKDLGENFVVKEGAEKTFIIQMNNPAWIDFSNTLSFDSVEE